MNPKFPLNDVTVRRVETTRKVENPLYADSFWQISQTEFAMQVEGVGEFYACNGNEVEYSPAEGTTEASVELYLNGSVYGAILHQRHILPIHGSSFVWNDKGIMLCGDSGAGKSSLTAAFCISGSQFLTDDVTPLVIRNGRPEIVPLSDRIKLWENALFQLNQGKDNLTPIQPQEVKYYFPMEKGSHDSFPLHKVFIIEKEQVKEETNEQESAEEEVMSRTKNEAQGDTVSWIELKGVDAFTALRNEVYRWEYLSAMPATEIVYLDRLISLSQQVRVFMVKRPEIISIAEMQKFLDTKIGEI
jgi:hypothetical protein